MNIKKTAQVIEHIVLIALIAGAVGFYVGNQYGQAHINVAALKTAQNTSK